MTQEFLESEILFPDDFDSDKPIILDSKYHHKSQNEVRFYYGDEFSGNRDTSHSYESRNREGERKKSSGTAPIDIPRKPPNRSTGDERETKLEDRELFFMPPHEIVATRFGNRVMPLPCYFLV